MKSWWITFTGRGPGCVEAETHEVAMELAKTATQDKPLGASIIPHPAEPRINHYEYPDGKVSPSFCCTPQRCVGRTACPFQPACTE